MTPLEDDGERLYEEFLRRFCEQGERAIDPGWPEEVQRRCRFLVRMALSSDKTSTQAPSFVETLARQGIAVRSSSGEPTAPEESLLPEGAVAERSGDEGQGRYRLDGEIARGGMGRILLAFDRDFRRHVAMKVMAGSPEPGQISRFVEEAQATAQLEHPNIGPVYDGGVGESGLPFFTMKWIRGRDLWKLIHAREEGVTLFRLVQIIQQVAMGVEFAHSRGVVHRDLKPQNIMVGDYGEVLVVDWGLAKILSRSADGFGELDEAASVVTDRVEEGARSIAGSIKGSAPYMSPEQASGDVEKIDARTDVFGLGAILYAALTGVAPYEGDSVFQVLRQAREARVVPPRERVPDREVPAELETVCLQALSKDPSARQPSAREFSEQLQLWVEGVHDRERRAAEASRLLVEAGGLRDEFRRACASADQLDEREASMRASIADHASADDKAPLWNLIDECRDAHERSSRLFDETIAAYSSVLRHEPQNEAAREALAELFSERVDEADSRGDREAVRVYSGLVAQYDASAHERLVRGRREVRISSNPSGAEVCLSRYEERGLLLVEGEPERVGVTPLTLQLGQGSYLSVLKCPGYADVRCPLLVDRKALRLGPQGVEIRMLRSDELPDSFVQIPAGDSILGGDPKQVPSFPRRRRHVGEFCVGRYPVTFGEYCEFLADELAASSTGEVDGQLAPSFGQEEYVVRRADGSFEPQERIHPRVPVIGLRKQAMLRYCEWLGRRLGRNVRLLTEEEWERCARGADGRVFPWGDGFDWALCHGAPSRAEQPWLEPVGTFRHDVSPFGVHDLAGSVRELCDAADDDQYSPTRGGSWYQNLPLIFRADARLRGLLSGRKTTDVGFRVCFSL